MSDAAQAAQAAGVGLIAVSTFAGFVLYSCWRSKVEAQPFVNAARREMAISTDDKSRFRAQVLVDMERFTVDENECPHSRLQMLPSHVPRLPDGCEEGYVYALDLGGTNFRVVAFNFGHSRGFSRVEASQQWTIPSELMVGKATALFDWMAQRLGEVMKHVDGRRGSKDTRRPLVGLCYSFALKQTGVAAGVQLNWTKGFDLQGGVGEDPVQLLKGAMQRAGVQADLCALCNDSVATLCAGSYTEGARNSQVHAGVVLGTGFNVACVELGARFPKWVPERGSYAAGEDPDLLWTVANMEAGALTTANLPLSEVDRLLDNTFNTPGHMAFEKLVSGMTLGPLTRLLLKHVLSATATYPWSGPFDVALTAWLASPTAIATRDLGRVVSDTFPDLPECRAAVAAALTRAAVGGGREWRAGDVPLQFAHVYRAAASAVLERASALLAAVLSATAMHVWRGQVVGTQLRRSSKSGLLSDRDDSAYGDSAPWRRSGTSGKSSGSSDTSLTLDSVRSWWLDLPPVRGEQLTFVVEGGTYAGLPLLQRRVRSEVAEQLAWERATGCGGIGALRVIKCSGGSALGVAAMTAAAARGGQ